MLVVPNGNERRYEALQPSPPAPAGSAPRCSEGGRNPVPLRLAEHSSEVNTLAVPDLNVRSKRKVCTGSRARPLPTRVLSAESPSQSTYIPPQTSSYHNPSVLGAEKPSRPSRTTLHDVRYIPCFVSHNERLLLRKPYTESTKRQQNRFWDRPRGAENITRVTHQEPILDASKHVSTSAGRSGPGSVRMRGCLSG